LRLLLRSTRSRRPPVAPVPEARPSNAPSIAGSPVTGAAPAPGADEVRRAALEAARARKAEEEKERARQRALIAEDKAARAARAEAAVVRASIAAPRLAHGSATTFKDVGIDTNAKGG